MLNEAWIAKAEQMLKKAKLGFGSDTQAIAQIEAEIAKMKKKHKAAVKRNLIIAGIIVALFIGSYVVGMLGFL